MQMHIPRIEDITEQNFAPYGVLIEPGSPIDRFTIRSRMFPLGFKLDTAAELYVIRYPDRGGVLSAFERHWNLTEVRIALGDDTVFMVAGNPATDDPVSPPDPSSVRAFRLKGNQGFIFHLNTWHTPSHPIGREQVELAIVSDALTEDELFGDASPDTWKRTQRVDFGDAFGVRYKIEI